MNTRKIEGQFTSFDGTKLFYRFFPHPRTSGFLILLHGHGEHCGRYEKFAVNLEAENLSIAAFDFRGHGRSGGRQVYVNSFEDFVSDVSSFVAYMQKEYALPSKFFLFGHSLGALTALHWSSQNSSRIRALFLSSPCLGLLLPPFLVHLNEWINRLIPGFVYRNPVYPPYLTHNTAEVAVYRQDPYIRRRITPKLLIEMLKSMKKLDEIPELTFPFPVYVMMSGLEKVVDGEKTKKVFSRITAPAKALVEFPDFYHEIFNELKQEEAFAALKMYIDDARAKGF